jgi:alkylated DNA repair protein alkB family protein 1
VATLRLRSGDAVLMSGESRYAWHSVPKILEGTCPTWMQQWPGSEWQQWDGWMERKRINLNVRQMFD